VYVHLRCIAKRLEKLSKMSTLSPPGKISADAHGNKSYIFFKMKQKLCVDVPKGSLNNFDV